MHLDPLHPRQSSSCVYCPPPPPCECSSNQVCFQINRDCNTCASFKCVENSNSSSSSGSGGVSKGALAGAAIGSLVFLAIAITTFLWYRRRNNRNRQNIARSGIKTDIPAPAATVLNRPDPTEKLPPTELTTVRVYSNTTINLNPESQAVTSPQLAHYSTRSSIKSNPFEDSHSIQTTGTEGTNVIPIALVSPESARSLSPVRPPRSQELNLNLDHVNVSRDTLCAPRSYAASQRSGVSAASSRGSFLSNASYSSDFLNEAPMIITSNQGAIRQVLGVVKAEVINAPGSQHSSTISEGIRSPLDSRPSVRSPLAATSFGPADLLREHTEGQEIIVNGDPFGDEHSPLTRPSPAASSATFGSSAPRTIHNSTTPSEWTPDGPNLPWSHIDDSSRPSSISTQAGSLVDIGSATRVNVGLNGLASPLSAGSFPRSPYRTTMGRLVTPSTAGLDTLEEQQQWALAHAHARAQAQAMDLNRRVSGSSVMSAASRADSILESFPFVPPSPISDRPVRSPPISPLGKQTFTSAPSSPLHKKNFTNQVSQIESTKFIEQPGQYLPPPPDRRTLGLSTGSQFSTTSSGLGSFSFQIDSDHNSGSTPPSAFKGHQRASLDTLALTSDLSSYPLGFDQVNRESFETFAASKQT